MRFLTSLLLSIAIAVSMISMFIVIRSAEAHYNVKTVTDVRVHCWLVGYPNRTLCQTNHFMEFEYERDGRDHTAVAHPRLNNVIIVIHRPGRARHQQTVKGTYRETRHMNVFDCDDC